MKINNISLYSHNLYGKYTNNNIYGNSYKKIKSFGKSNNDNSFKAFKTWAEETDFYSKALNIIDFTGEILGSGFEGTTYEIPDNDNWVIKEEKRSASIPVKTDSPQITEIPDLTPNLNLGQMIAHVIVPSTPYSSRRFFILKKQKGETYGVSYDKRNQVSESNINTHLKSLKLLSSFPIDSFKEVVEEVVQANKAGLKFDFYNPNNIMIDEENKKINFVDVDKGSIHPLKNQLADILFSLLDGEFAKNFNKYCNSNTKKNEARKYSYEIICKFETAVRACGADFQKTAGYEMLLNSLLK